MASSGDTKIAEGACCISSDILQKHHSAMEELLKRELDDFKATLERLVPSNKYGYSTPCLASPPFNSLPGLRPPPSKEERVLADTYVDEESVPQKDRDEEGIQHSEHGSRSDIERSHSIDEAGQQNARKTQFDRTWEHAKALSRNSSTTAVLKTMGVEKLDDAYWDTLQKQRLPLPLLKSLVASSVFSVSVMFLIVSNAVLMAISSDLAMKKALSNFDDQMPPAQSMQELYPTWANHLEHVFTILFGLELIVRLLALEGTFFFGSEWQWNMLDSAIVLSSFLDTVLSVAGLELSYIRLLRILRMIRTTRVIRIIRFFRTLRLMLLSLMHSVVPLFWAIIFLTFIMFFFAILFIQGAATYIGAYEYGNSDTVRRLERYFSSLARTFLSLFMAVTGGYDWRDCTDTLADVSSAYVTLMAAYVAVMTLVVMNVVTGIFVSDAVEMAQNDRDLLAHAQMERTRSVVRELSKFFKETDANQSGTITLDEFEFRMQNHDAHHYFLARGLDMSDARKVFKLMDVDGSGELDIGEFIVGCMQLKGGAKAVDMETLLREVKAQLRRTTRTVGHLFEQVYQLDARVALASENSTNNLSV